MKKLLLVSLFLLVSLNILYPQSIRINKIEPPNWWTGMKWNKLQLMVYGENLRNVSVHFLNNQIKVVKVYNIENPYYAFIDINIPNSLSPGIYKLIFEKEGNKVQFNYPIYKRDKSINIHQGFTSEDVIYLITPDRFENGDTSNDRSKEVIDDFRPYDKYGRHGGDIQGIINELDYLNDLGVTSIWINPLVENNTRMSYHGYASTDFYKIDPRFGTNELYKKLVEKAHKKNLKIILDHVNNHFSINHLWIKNLPVKDWINGSVENHIYTPHYKISLADIYSDSITISNTINGWFTGSMPDFNQKNLFVKTYLIQNTIWWIEYSGLDGIREDTYPYSDQKYLAEWAQDILHEYPNFNIVGEVWIYNPIFLSYFQSKSPLRKNIDTALPSVTDFAMYNIYHDYLTGKSSLYNIYEGLCCDVVYNSPQNLVTFLDNHDLKRAIYYSNGDIEKFKIALVLLLTTRGIPQIYYGSEIGLPGGDEDGTIRQNFPGGFPGDNKNAFTDTGRTIEQNELYNYTKLLLHLRQKYKSLNSGNLTQFPPKDNLYIYFKNNKTEKIMVIVNGNDVDKDVDLNLINQHFNNIKTLKNLITGDELKYTKELKLNAEKMTGSLYLLTE